MVLRDPTIDAAVLGTARGGILREGLGFDRCDVGVVLNVRSDHLGMRGVETLEELAEVKALVVEVVREDGCSVLNADDPLTAAMAGRAEGKVIYFSSRHGAESPPHLREHLAQGGAAVLLQPSLKGDMVTIFDGEHCIPLMWAHSIPATLHGQAPCNVANALAATAICHALQVPVETLRQALGSFAPSYYQNPGRLNFYDGHPFRVLLDYGHNPDALERVGELVHNLRPSYCRVLTVLGGTGDRRDEDLRRLGAVAAGFTHLLILRQDDDLRGRPSGEAARLVHEGALEAGLSSERIRTVLPEAEAVTEALQLAQPGDLVLVFADDIARCWQQVTGYHAPAYNGESVRREPPRASSPPVSAAPSRAGRQTNRRPLV